MTARATLLLAALALPGCVINSDKWLRPRDLSPAWLVDRTRLLAVRAEPPEIRPGESATFEALMPSPGGDELTQVWFACPLLDGADFGCFLDLASVDFETTDPAALAELGFIGIVPGFPPSYTAPTDLLDGLAGEAERAEGVQVLVQVSGLPADLALDTAAEVDFAELEAGFKRLVVSEASTPNHNPQIGAFQVDRFEVPPGSTVHLSPYQAYELGAVISDSTLERYQFLNSEGVVEERVEEPYVAWYTTGGDMLEEYTLYPYTEATWVSPDERGASGTWYAVARDRRGGMAWWVQDWVVD